MLPMNPDPGFGDNLYDDPILDHLEGSIEQFTPAGAFDPDPLHGMLDAVEDSVEQISPAPADLWAEPMRDPLWDTLDKLETDMESQVIPPEASGFEPPTEPVPEAFGSFESKPPLPDDEEHFIRERPLPAGLSKGHMGTGSRCQNSRDISLGWCQLRNELVSSLECGDCDDYSGESECEYWSDEE
jgi:hypothetical protein